MKRDSVVFAICGAFFGLIVGWILGSQDSPRPLPVESRDTNAVTQNQTAESRPPRSIDLDRAKTLMSQAERDASDVSARVQLGNLYYDAERYQDAARWYEQAIKLDPKNPNVSTDLGVSYYYLNQPDRALQQFDHSLKLDPRHTKTMLNIGIVRAFGKQDLQGAAQAWRQVIRLSPDSPEGLAAKEALSQIESAHPNLTSGPSGS